MLALVAMTALGIVNITNTQDVTRLALTRSLLEDGSLRIDRFVAGTSDFAVHDGHYYSDKAPGMSLLAVPSVEAIRAVDAVTGRRSSAPVWNRETHLWLLRLATGGVVFVLAVFLVGRVAAGLAPRAGAATAVTFGLGTLAAPLGPTTFGHVAAGTLGLASFLLVWRGGSARAHLGAGLLAGCGFLCEYPAALIGLVVLLYAALRGRARAAALVAAGAVPPALLLGAYNWAAFGSPFRLSYDFVANAFASQQQGGFFGIHVPRADSVREVLVGDQGLLVVSPVLVAAAAGLVLLWRRGWRAEAAVCAAVSVLFFFLNAGYFYPYGGTSPGARFFVPALPFLALGLAPAFDRWPFVTGMLALASIIVCTWDALTWAIAKPLELAPWPQTVWAYLNVGRPAGGVIVIATAAAAALVAARQLGVPARRGVSRRLR